MTNLQILDFIGEVTQCLKAAQRMDNEIWNGLFVMDTPNEENYRFLYDKFAMFAWIEEEFLYKVKAGLELIQNELEEKESPSRVGSTQRGEAENT